MDSRTVIWKRHDLLRTEACRLTQLAAGWQLTVVAVLVYERQPCRLDYLVALYHSARREAECHGSGHRRAADCGYCPGHRPRRAHCLAPQGMTPPR
jgi:hypothetical protein